MHRGRDTSRSESAGLDQGSFADAPSFSFKLPSTIKVDRQYHGPGFPPLPSDVLDEVTFCAGGGGGLPGPTQTSDCGAKQYDLNFVIQVPQPNKLYLTVASGASPGDRYPVPGVLNNSDLVWTLTLCRVVNDQAAC